LGVRHLQVVPKDVRWLHSLRNFDGLAADLEKCRIFDVLIGKVVSVVLVLEADEGFPSELGQHKGVFIAYYVRIHSGARIYCELLAKLDELSVQNFDLVGNVRDEVCIFERNCLVVVFCDEPIDQLLPEIV
jgi:hypothetical protein